MKTKLTQKRLKEVLKYSPSSGKWVWIVRKAFKTKIGSIAGSTKNPDGYRFIHIDNALYKSSRLAWLYMKGYFPENEVDHKNRIRDDDRWKNLKEVTHQCNSKNRNLFINNKSGVSGVCWKSRDKRWEANIKENNKQIYLGSFKKKTKAVKARLEAEIKYNWPGCSSYSSAFLYLQKRNLIK